MILIRNGYTSSNYLLICINEVWKLYINKGKHIEIVILTNMVIRFICLTFAYVNLIFQSLYWNRQMTPKMYAKSHRLITKWNFTVILATRVPHLMNSWELELPIPNFCILCEEWCGLTRDGGAHEPWNCVHLSRSWGVPHLMKGWDDYPWSHDPSGLHSINFVKGL